MKATAIEKRRHRLDGSEERVFYACGPTRETLELALADARRMEGSASWDLVEELRALLASYQASGDAFERTLGGRAVVESMAIAKAWLNNEKAPTL